MSTDLGRVNLLGADAVGAPGQRRFRLFARSEYATAVVWMEKEYLRTLAQTLDEVLKIVIEGEVLRLEARPGGLPEPSGMPDDFPTLPTYEFHIGQIKLNYDEQDDTFLLLLTPLEIALNEDEQPEVIIREDDAIIFHFLPQDALALANEVNLLMEAGRPTCPYCKAPLGDGPHSCAKQNGHQKIARIELRGSEDEDEEE
uniref:DUF3090 family protein n=1 Tax=Thermosporothrix sp. COM3 TaxID=2490863 RepID=A0A455SZB2_9CHLR|nr:hypothetical protein KTC_52550 [Thermosporothrix sp. COM3]